MVLIVLDKDKKGSPTPLRNLQRAVQFRSLKLTPIYRSEVCVEEFRKAGWDTCLSVHGIFVKKILKPYVPFSVF